MARHYCNRLCVCPECGRPLLHSRKRGHRCPDPLCSNAKRKT